MATADNSKTRRVKEITEFIHSRGWSLNGFLINFYSSTDSTVATQRGCCLAKSSGSRFAPEELVNLWFDHCPQSSRPYLERVIIDRASKIIIKETQKACEKESLQVPTTSLEADDLDEDFLLARLETDYAETLPHLCFLLNAVITSKNRSEQQKGEVASSKEDRAKFVEFSSSFRDRAPSLSNLLQACVVVVSIILFAKNRATNAFQIIMGLFLGISGASKRVLSVCNHMGVCISYE
jgi:hypothetical protein